MLGRILLNKKKIVSSFNILKKSNLNLISSYSSTSFLLKNEKEIRFNHRAGPAIAFLISQGLSGAQIEAILDAYSTPPTLSDLRELGDSGLAALIKSVDHQIKEKEEQLKKILEKSKEDEVKTSSDSPTSFTKLVKKTPKSASVEPKTVTIHVTPNNSLNTFTLPLRIGANLFEEIRYHPALKNALPGTCGGQAACSTCHVYLVPPDYDDELPPLMDEPDSKELYAKILSHEKIESPMAYEDDMIDLCADSRPGASRLSCQVTITPELNNYKLIVPDSFVNLF